MLRIARTEAVTNVDIWIALWVAPVVGTERLLAKSFSVDFSVFTISE